ncbi:arsenic resistance N-acetyltransferase ArsN2 [Rhizobium daejeonense]
MLRAGGEPMLSAIALHELAGSDARLREALRAADLPTDDIEDEGRAFLEAVFDDGQTIGYAGLERCAGDYLLRSVVVLPEHRGHGFGRAIVEATLRGIGGDVFLATTSAAPFFSSIGFSEVLRTEVPAAVLATRQLSSICPSSATIMKLNRPPT